MQHPLQQANFFEVPLFVQLLGVAGFCLPYDSNYTDGSTCLLFTERWQFETSIPDQMFLASNRADPSFCRTGGLLSFQILTDVQQYTTGWCAHRKSPASHRNNENMCGPLTSQTVQDVVLKAQVLLMEFPLAFRRCYLPVPQNTTAADVDMSCREAKVTILDRQHSFSHSFEQRLCCTYTLNTSYSCSSPKRCSASADSLYVVRTHSHEQNYGREKKNVKVIKQR